MGPYSSHLEGVKPLVADGVITMGGEYLASSLFPAIWPRW
jgi:hypothetical protein